MHSLLSFGRRWVAVVLALVVTPSGVSAAADDPGSTYLSSGQAVTAALTAHPDLIDAASGLDVARARAQQSAWFLNNPQLAATTTLDGSSSELEVLQPLSLTGEGWHARATARADIEAAEFHLHRRRLEIAAEVRGLYVDAAVAVSLADIAAEGYELAGQLRDATERQYAVGENSLLSLRLTKMAEAQAGAELLAARDDEADALSRLAWAVGGPVSAGTIGRDPASPVPDASRELGHARSDLQAAAAAVKVAERDLARQRAAVLPAVAVGARLERTAGELGGGPAVELVLPLFDRNQVGRTEAGRAFVQAESELASVSALAATELATSQRRQADATAIEHRVGPDLVDEARAALRSVTAGTQAGEIDLPTAVLLQAEIVDGEAAAVRLSGSAAHARLDLLLANDDPNLLNGDTP